MARQVIVTPQAEAHIQTIDAWWRRNRKDSPALFVRELGEAFSTLEVAPEAGSRRRSRCLGVCEGFEAKSLILPVGYAQTELADLLGSSRSRVAKMEAGDPSVSVDLLIRALLALGVNRKQGGSAIGATVSA